MKTAQIVNGKTAIPHSWPSIAKIVMEEDNGYKGYCGGTLIDNRTVLSAAQLSKIIKTLIFSLFKRDKCS